MVWILGNACDGDRRFAPLTEAITVGECARFAEIIDEWAQKEPSHL
jgi:hypothetical protein